MPDYTSRFSNLGFITWRLIKFRISVLIFLHSLQVGTISRTAEEPQLLLRKGNHSTGVGSNAATPCTERIHTGTVRITILTAHNLSLFCKRDGQLYSMLPVSFLFLPATWRCSGDRTLSLAMVPTANVPP